MNYASLKAAMPCCLLAATSLTLAPASAHEDSNLSLGGGKRSIDTYQYSCDTGTDRLFVQVLAHGAKKQPKVTVLTIGPRGGAKSATDPNSTNAAPSPGFTVPDGAGIYYLMVYKSAKGSILYDLTFHCQDSNGNHTSVNSELVPLQDQ